MQFSKLSRRCSYVLIKLTRALACAYCFVAALHYHYGGEQSLHRKHVDVARGIERLPGSLLLGASDIQSMLDLYFDLLGIFVINLAEEEGDLWVDISEQAKELRMALLMIVQKEEVVRTKPIFTIELSFVTHVFPVRWAHTNLGSI